MSFHESIADAVSTHKEGALLRLHVQPGSKKAGLLLEMRGLRLKLRERAIEGSANRGCVGALSSYLNQPKSQIELIRGKRSQEKTLLFRGISVTTLENKLSLYLSERLQNRKSWPS